MEDSSATAALKDLQGRIKSMALVLERLYRSESLSRINFQDYLEALISHLRTSFGPGSAIRCEVALTDVEMTLDAAVPCGMIVNELVSNAFKHAFPQGVCNETNCDIAVSIKRDGTAYTLTVADNGVGLPADLDWETTKSLGLRLVRMLGQHQLGGKLEPRPHRGDQVYPHVQPHEVTMAREKILIVEDDGILAAQLENTLTGLGYAVFKPAATGEDAIDRAKADNPDLILMDIHLAGVMDGITAAGRIASFSDVPLIYLTGYAEEPLLNQAKFTAPYGYLVKPVSRQELAATIEMSLYRHDLDAKLKESDDRLKLARRQPIWEYGSGR